MKVVVKHSAILGLGMVINVLGVLMVSWLLTPDNEGLVYISALVLPALMMYLVAGLLVPSEWVKDGKDTDRVEEDLPNDGISYKDDMRRVLANLAVSTLGATVMGLAILQVTQIGNTGIEALLGMYLPYILPYGYLLYRTMSNGKVKEEKHEVGLYAVNVVVSILGIVLTGSFYTDTIVVGIILVVISCGLTYRLDKLAGKKEESEKIDLTKEADLG